MGILVKSLSEAENQTKGEGLLAGANKYASNGYVSLNEHGETPYWSDYWHDSGGSSWL